MQAYIFRTILTFLIFSAVVVIFLRVSHSSAPMWDEMTGIFMEDDIYLNSTAPDSASSSSSDLIDFSGSQEEPPLPKISLGRPKQIDALRNIDGIQFPVCYTHFPGESEAILEAKFLSKLHAHFDYSEVSPVPFSIRTSKRF